MKTAKLDEIVRQRDPELKQVVEQFARGEVMQAVANLDDQGRVHEYTGRDERIAAIAKEYARAPQNTLVVSPDNRSRMEINQRIHSELQSRGLVNREEHTVKMLVPRQEMTGADRTWARQYQVDDILRYSRSSRETGINKGEYTRVVGIDAQANLLTVVRADGSEQTYDPRRQMGVIAYRAQERTFSVGDRIQFTSPDNEQKIANRELGTVEGFGADGKISLKLDGGRSVAIDPELHPHIDHGYAMTSYSSQGQTAERVLVHVDTELGAKDLLNNRMAYVAISRGQNDAQIFTNSADKLAGVLARDVSHQSAIEPQIGGTHPVQDIAKALNSELSHGIELGIGL